MISFIKRGFRRVFNEIRFALTFPWAKSISSKLGCVHTRSHIPQLLTSLGLTGEGIELGVREGRYSWEILARSKLARLYSIDMWAGDSGHDEQQMQGAIDRLASFGDRTVIVQAVFKEALKTFDDEQLDFVYIDGYAHDGQNDGETLRDWWPKVKVGGIFSGHDYHLLWERNVRAVDQFVKEHGLKFNLTESDQYPSWIIIKTAKAPTNHAFGAID